MARKQSFSEIQQVSRRDAFRWVAYIGIAIAVIIGIAAAFRFIGRKPETEAEAPEAPLPPPVPTSINYYDPASEGTYTAGTDYVILMQDGSRIRVNADGTVYVLDENGNPIQLLTGAAREDAIDQALEIQGYDSMVNIALSGLEDIVEPDTAASGEVRDDDYTLSDRIEDLVASRGLTMDQFNAMLYELDTDPAQFMRIASSDRADVEALVMSTIDSAQHQGEGERPGLAADVEGVNIQQEATSPVQETEYPDWLTPIDPGSTMSAMVSALGNATAVPDGRTQAWEAVNQNAAQQSWLDEQQSREITQQMVDDHYLVAGTVIPITIVTGINTDLPGDVVGVVRQNVYDTLTGRNLLIPKGSRVLANYNNSVAFGQKRVQIAWNQLVTPDGYVFTFPGFQGVDPEGFSGSSDKYSSHFWSTLGGALLGSIINYGTGWVEQQTEAASGLVTGADVLQILAGSTLDTSQDYMENWIDLWMNRQPTITIRPGYQTQLLVNQNINLRRTL